MPDVIRRVFKSVLIASFVALCCFSINVHADSQADLQNKISDTNAQIKALQDEIAKLQSQLSS